MTFNEYQASATKTDIRAQEATVNLRLMCSILGLIEEIDEFERLDGNDDYMDFISEASDIFWYSASICTELNIPFDTITSYQKGSIHPAKVLKKTYRDHKGVMPINYREGLLSYIRLIITRLIPERIAFYKDAKVEDNVLFNRIMEYNIMKLQDRYERNAIQGDGNNR